MKIVKGKPNYCLMKTYVKLKIRAISQNGEIALFNTKATKADETYSKNVGFGK